MLKEVMIVMVIPKDCRDCPIDKMCDSYTECVWPVYVVGFKKGNHTEEIHALETQIIHATEAGKPLPISYIVKRLHELS